MAEERDGVLDLAELIFVCCFDSCDAMSSRVDGEWSVALL